MVYSNATACITTHTVIESLMKAYDACTNREAKEAVYAAVKAVMNLDHEIRNYVNRDSVVDADGYHDPSEYCAAV